MEHPQWTTSFLCPPTHVFYEFFSKTPQKSKTSSGGKPLIAQPRCVPVTDSGVNADLKRLRALAREPGIVVFVACVPAVVALVKP